MNNLKPFSKGLKGNSSNQSPDFSLDVLHDPNLQNFKKRKIKNHNIWKPAQIKKIVRQRTPNFKY